MKEWKPNALAWISEVYVPVIMTGTFTFKSSEQAAMATVQTKEGIEFDVPAGYLFVNFRNVIGVKQDVYS